MKKYFDPEQVMSSLRKIAVGLEEATETDTTLADGFPANHQSDKNGASPRFELPAALGIRANGIAPAAETTPSGDEQERSIIGN